MNRVAKIASAFAVLFGLVLPSYAFARQQFHGKLSSRLSLGMGYVPLLWHPATARQRTDLGALANPSDRVWVGKLSFGFLTPLTFKAALIKTKSGDYFLYVDRNHTGRLTAADKITLLPGKKAHQTPHADFSLPLEHGPYKTFPVSVMVPDPGMMKIKKVSFPLVVSIEDNVQGFVQLPNRKLLVSYTYTLAKNQVFLETAQEGMDVNGNGKIDFFGEHDQPQHGKLPIFHVGNLYLRTKSVNVKTGEVTLEEIPANVAGHRIFWQNGVTIPDFRITPFTGRRTTFAKIKGRYTLIDFWASWCEPCMTQFPVLKKAYAEYHSRGLQIVGINGDFTDAAAFAALAKVKAPWPEASGGNLISRFHIVSWPSEMLVNSDGKIVASSNNESMEGNSLDKVLAKFFPGK